MTANAPDDSQIRRYLLGQLPVDKKTAFEEEYFLNAATLMQMEIAEEELIDDYLAQQLSRDERRSFEQFFLTTPQRKEKLHFAEALREHSQGASRRDGMASKSTIPQPILMRAVQGALAASLILNLGLAWLLNSETQQTERLQAEVAAPSVASKAYAYDLDSGAALRSEGGLPRLDLPADALLLELRLALNPDAQGYPSYQAEFSQVDGGALLLQMDLHPRGEGERGLIDLSLPARSLNSGDYMVRLKRAEVDGSLEELDRYGFRITRIP